MIRTTVKKEFECSGCKKLPRPGQTTVKKCTTCSKIFCITCGIGSHLCSDGIQRNPDGSVPLKIDVEFLPYFCKNSKFGCEEILFKDSELFKHEHSCDFQIICCPEFDCKNEVNLLNYLDHFKEKHDDHGDLGESKTFKLPLPMDQIQSQTLKISLKNDPLVGKYEISNAVVNGKPNWVMNLCAIWYQDQTKSWNIGHKKDLGKNSANIYCSCTAFQGPDDSNNLWNYSNPSRKFVKDDGNDVSVRSICDEGKYSTFLKYPPLHKEGCNRLGNLQWTQETASHSSITTFLTVAEGKTFVLVFCFM